MKRLLVSCEKCRRNSWVDFDGDATALAPILSGLRDSHLVEDLCTGKLVTAVAELSPIRRFDGDRPVTLSGVLDG